jgi:uncharacterized protein (TIGR04255 family)
MSLEFSNLPLEEVTVRAVLGKQIGISIGHLLQLWDVLKPHFNSPVGLEALEIPALTSVEIGPSVVAGLAASRSGVELAVQANLLLARWRRRAGEPYPRYAALREAMELAYPALLSTLGTQESTVQVVNMTYTNLILPPPSEEPTQYVSGLINVHFWPTAIERKPLHDLNLSWRGAQDLDLRLMLQKVTIPIPKVLGDGTTTTENREAFALRTVAGTHSTAPDNPIMDLDRMHEALQEFFASVITDRARKEWGYAGG